MREGAESKPRGITESCLHEGSYTPPAAMERGAGAGGSYPLDPGEKAFFPCHGSYGYSEKAAILRKSLVISIRGLYISAVV